MYGVVLWSQVVFFQERVVGVSSSVQIKIGKNCPLLVLQWYVYLSDAGTFLAIYISSRPRHVL